VLCREETARAKEAASLHGAVASSSREAASQEREEASLASDASSLTGEAASLVGDASSLIGDVTSLQGVEGLRVSFGRCQLQFVGAEDKSSAPTDLIQSHLHDNGGFLSDTELHVNAFYCSAN